MDREDEKKLTLAEYSWHLINNLSEFNDKPELIINVYKKMSQRLPEHPILFQFYDYFKTAIDYFENHKNFPTIDWFRVNYLKSAKLKITSAPFSIQVYEDFVKLVDAEIIKKACGSVVNTVSPDITQLRQLSNTINTYCDNAASIPPLTKANIIDMYDEYSKDYSGVRTGISQLDEVIGVLGHKSLSVYGAPSGHGKSTFAISLAFNAAVHQGLCVDYISYEVPKEHIWFNLISLMSAELGIKDPIASSELKEATLPESKKEIYKDSARELLKAIKMSGGYISIMDQTTAAVDTFEGLCARIEGMAAERVDGDKTFDRKADLIIIDNVDNLQILKSSERDEQVKVNNYIIKLDSFVKQYHHNDGCCMLLLTQLNRGGLERLTKAEGETQAGEKTNRVDVTVFQKFNALYEKPTCCLVGYADAAMRIANRCTVYPVKLRNRPIPDRPISLPADFKHSKIGGMYENIDGMASKATTPAMMTAPEAVIANHHDFDPAAQFSEANEIFDDYDTDDL